MERQAADVSTRCSAACLSRVGAYGVTVDDSWQANGTVTDSVNKEVQHGSESIDKIADFGQSVWYDNISRSLVQDGELKRLIDEDGVVGQTSNPNFFKEAIVGKADYDDQMRELAQQGKSGDEIYEVLTTTDVRGACDLFAPVYQRTTRMMAMSRSRSRRHSRTTRSGPSKRPSDFGRRSIARM